MKTFAAALSLALAAAVSAREFETYDKFVAKAGEAEEMPLFAGLQVDGDDDNEGKKSKKDNKKDSKKESTASAKKDSKKDAKKDNKKSSTTSSGDSKNKRNNSSSSTSSSSSSSTSSSNDKRKYNRSSRADNACLCENIDKKDDEEFCKELWDEVCSKSSNDLNSVCDDLGSEDCWDSADEEEMPLFAGLAGDGDEGKKKKKAKKKNDGKKKDNKKDNKSESSKKDTKKEKKDAKKDNKSSTSSSESKKKRNNSSSSTSSSSSSSSSSSTSSSDKRKRSSRCDGRGLYACECKGMDSGDKKFCKKLWYDECKDPLSPGDEENDDCYFCGSEDCWSKEEVANLRGNVAAVE